jgi:hypothetical protein
MSEKSKEIDTAVVDAFQNYLNTLEPGTYRIVMGNLAANSTLYRQSERAAAVAARAAKANARFNARTAPVEPAPLPPVPAAPAPLPAAPAGKSR